MTSRTPSRRIGSRPGARLAVACAASVGVHGGIVLLAGAIYLARALFASPAPPELARTAPERTIAIELPTMAEGSVASDTAAPDPVGTPPPRGGGEGTPRPDSGRAGRGGTNTAEAPAINLADRDEAMLRQAEIASRLDRDQVQRLRTARTRASREDWRASRRPMELTFLAMGHATRPERRPPARVDPSAGADGSAAPSRKGATLGAAEIPHGFGERPRDPGAADLGGAAASPGLGLRDGRPGADHHQGAAVAEGRPMVAEGTPSVPAEAQDKPRDTQDSEQEVARAIQSIVHASTAGGAHGTGPGGEQGPGATGAGGPSGAGSRAHALGTGVGPGIDDDLRDQRRNLYVRQVTSRIHWADAFPHWAELEGRQGVTMISFLVGADGTIQSASITRPSGIPEFDENCRRAVLRAAPLPPLPPELGSSLRIALSFDTRNPAVRPRSPRN